MNEITHYNYGEGIPGALLATSASWSACMGGLFFCLAAIAPYIMSDDLAIRFARH